MRKSFLLKEWYFVIIRSELYISLLVCLVRTIGADFKTEAGFLKPGQLLLHPHCLGCSGPTMRGGDKAWSHSADKMSYDRQGTRQWKCERVHKDFFVLFPPAELGLPGPESFPRAGQEQTWFMSYQTWQWAIQPGWLADWLAGWLAGWLAQLLAYFFPAVTWQCAGQLF